MLSGCGVPVFPNWFSITFLIIVVEVMTSGLPHISKLWLGVSKGMLPVKHIAPKILMAVNNCGQQVAHRLDLAAPAYYEIEGTSLHPGMCDWRPDGRVGGAGWDVGCR